MEMERGADIMVVTHQAVLRCIYAYFMNVPQDQSPWMEIPLHTVIKLTPRAYGTQEERYCSFCHDSEFQANKYFRFKAEIPAVSTFRAKYASANMGSTNSTVDESTLKPQRPLLNRAETNGHVEPRDDVIAAVTTAKRTAEAKVGVLSASGDTMLAE
jgi:6-phosphofructo-2-kinase/fructose-2,6-biphosphatase 2